MQLTSRLFFKRLYIWTRDLHLYLGLFLSPFVVLFALSAISLNHNLRPERSKTMPVVRSFAGLRIPPGLERSEGMDRAQKVRELLPQVGVTGEVSFINYDARQRRMEVPVQQAGHDATIEIDFAAASATVTKRTTGVWDALSFLHKMPGPHNTAIRKNWFVIRLWGYMADATVYLLLFLTATGIYLWLALKLERRAGLVFGAGGLMSFVVVVYGLCR